MYHSCEVIISRQQCLYKYVDNLTDGPPRRPDSYLPFAVDLTGSRDLCQLPCGRRRKTYASTRTKTKLRVECYKYGYFYITVEHLRLWNNTKQVQHLYCIQVILYYSFFVKKVCFVMKARGTIYKVTIPVMFHNIIKLYFNIEQLTCLYGWLFTTCFTNKRRK